MGSLILQWLTRRISAGRNAGAITAARSAKSACTATTRYHPRGKYRGGRTLTSCAEFPSTTLCGAATTSTMSSHPAESCGINARKEPAFQTVSWPQLTCVAPFRFVFCVGSIIPRNAPAVNRGGAAFCVLGLLSGAQFTGQAPGGRRIRHFVLAGAAMLCCGATSGNRWI